MKRLCRLSLLLATASVLAGCATAPQLVANPAPIAAPVAAAPAAAEIAPVSALVSQVTIPHSSFKLDNGLTVIVHEDRKAPIVAVATWYNVGSKDEPKGRSGFAHLFEHLMFNGSENVPGDYFTWLQKIGATDENGTTNNDRTNYFQTVPKGALERILFMESDRMGYLLGAVTQGVLDNQRGVVQNEKRQGENRPGGLVWEEVLKQLFPEGHPYRHTVIGYMQDLDAASLADVGDWFRDKYGPNNAVLVLAGDVDAAEARPLVEKYFGRINRGPVNNPAQAAIPTLDGPKSLVMKDRVAATGIGRYWVVPGVLEREAIALDLGASVLGGLASSRFDEVLVKGEQLAVSASASQSPLHRVGIFALQATVKPGIDPATVGKRMDEILAELIAKGPSDDELRRAATVEVAERIRGLEQVGGFGGKAVTLASGQTFAADSDFYRKTLAQYASVTPAEVRAAMAKWLSRPALSTVLEPGERPPYKEAASVNVAGKTKADPNATASRRGLPRTMPGVSGLANLDFPDVTRARLSNGIEIAYARRTAVPVTRMAIMFDAGSASETPSSRGIEALTLDMLDEGAGRFSSQEFVAASEGLGGRIAASSGADRSGVTMSALSANLAPSLDLVAAMLREPRFDSSELDRVRTQSLTAIEQLKKDPGGIARRALPALLYGESHPYAALPGGDAAFLARATRDDLIAYQQRWLRSDKARIYIVSDRPLAEIEPLIEARLGDWAAPTVPPGIKDYSASIPAASAQRIVLIDRPGSPQSVISGALVTGADPRADMIALEAANDVLGGNFLSRINSDLRETKGWSYGSYSGLGRRERAVSYQISAPVQADRTGDAIRALNDQLSGFMGAKGVTADELSRTVAQGVNGLPGQFETSGAVLSAMIDNDVYGRPANYYETVAGTYRGLTAGGLNQVIRGAVNPRHILWVVVGDAAKIRPQLDKLGIPVTVEEAR